MCRVSLCAMTLRSLPLRRGSALARLAFCRCTAFCRLPLWHDPALGRLALLLRHGLPLRRVTLCRVAFSCLPLRGLSLRRLPRVCLTICRLTFAGVALVGKLSCNLLLGDARPAVLASRSLPIPGLAFRRIAPGRRLPLASVDAVARRGTAFALHFVDRTAHLLLTRQAIRVRVPGRAGAGRRDAAFVAGIAIVADEAVDRG